MQGKKQKPLLSREEKIEWIVRWAEAHTSEEIKNIISQYQSSLQSQLSDQDPRH